MPDGVFVTHITPSNIYRWQTCPIATKETDMSELISNAKAQELVSYLNKRIKDTGYNERQCAGNTVVFERPRVYAPRLMTW
jgi:hypothetical protein